VHCWLGLKTLVLVYGIFAAGLSFGDVVPKQLISQSKFRTSLPQILGGSYLPEEDVTERSFHPSTHIDFYSSRSLTSKRFPTKQ
jgi:hypothetical protein